MNAEHATLAMTWGNMIARCYDPKSQRYADYGGRGITVSDQWHEFANFANDMSPRPKGLTLDRIDNECGYSKDNCRWATTADQNRNRRDTINLTINGETKCVTDWAAESDVSIATIFHRVHNGWSASEAVFGRKFAKRYPGINYLGENLTAKQWAKRLGLKYGTLSKRLARGIPFEDAISEDNATRVRVRNLTSPEGVTHSTIEWSLILGVSESTIRNRLHRRWPIERVLTPGKES